jgi:hypothetical protein
MANEQENDDGLPWASPEIQRKYEAALGRFMLEFNRLDTLLGETLEFVLAHLDRKDQIKDWVGKDFALKLFFLDRLKHSSGGCGIKHVSIPDLKNISGARNFFAHGHFDQNPYDGSYVVRLRDKKPSYYSAKVIDGLTEHATKASDALRSSHAFYLFSSNQQTGGT